MNGPLIRDTRARLDISLMGLAAVLGVSPTFLGEVEREKRAVPDGWESTLTRSVLGWHTAMRACIANKHPECAALLVHNSAQVVSAPVKCQMCEVHAASYHRNGEARAFLLRLVKYAQEDKPVTPRATRLARLVDQVDDYLKRTNNPSDILRGGG